MSSWEMSVIEKELEGQYKWVREMKEQGNMMGL